MSLKQLIITVLIGFIFAGCHLKSNTKQEPVRIEAQQKTLDPYSYSRHDQVKISHIDLDLRVKFKHQTLDGSVILNYQIIDPKAQQLVLDTRGLKIKRIEAMNDKKNNKLLWRFGQQSEQLGSELIIDLPHDKSPIKIMYETTPDASGLQWLSPEQTSGKKHPFLFSQSQAIHARSWIPLQDTPSVRVTYDATIRVKPGVIPLLSADNNNQVSTDGIFNFTMKQAIPAYLIAIAVGDLASQQVSEHVTIYAEQDVLASAVNEFAATEDMITATEDLYGPYKWGQYDLLILPPSFSFWRHGKS